MSLTGNGIFVVRGELATLMTAMRRGARWNSNSYHDEQQDGLMKPLYELKTILHQTEDLRLIEPNKYLSPFLNIIKSEETTGVVTSLALSAVNKFLSYGLIDPTHATIANTVENIAYAANHARFVGTDPASDAVVLMKIVQVLRTLMLSPEGSSLSNDMICEVMLSCFKICFESRLNEILRRSAEQALRDMVLLLFMRLPQFAEDLQPFNMSKKLKMDHEGGIGRKRTKVKQEIKPQTKISEKIGENNSTEEPTSPNMHLLDPNSNSLKAPALSSTPSTPAGNIVDMRGKFVETPSSSLVQNSEKEGQESEEVPEKDPLLSQDNSLDNEADVEDEGEELNSQTVESVKGKKPKEEYVNSVGVRFTQQTSKANNILLPYGLPCIRELFRFLVSLCNPYDKQNTDAMIHIGLNLLTVAFEIGADSIGNYHTLMTIVKDEMCRNLFSLLSTERLSIFQADLQLCFLLFESLRSHLKFQLENYLNKLAEIIASDNPKIPYETRELALENILQLWRIPGFVAELYINYDCDLYCTNLFEDLTKLLSKTALSATQSIYSIHLLSMDALNAIMEVLERNCTAVNKGSIPVGSRHSRNNSTADRIVLDIETPGSGNESSAVETENISNYIGVSRLERYSKNINERQSVSHEQLMDLKEKKRILSQGTELFNNKAEKGIQYLQENGVLNPVLDPKEVAQFLRENSGLDKKQIGEFVSKKKNVESKILEHFVKSFDFTNLRIDMALRLYLETFRLPGEAPLISLVMEHFADHWHILNGEPFAHVDAAFGLAYAVIMLNMDQHNHNVKKMNIPMTVDEFVRNLRGMNGKADFDHDMLVNIYNAIKNEEIVMPAEQTGQIRESYLWKVLLRRGAGKDGQFHHVMGAVHDRELFQLIWGPTLAALSFMFDKSSDMSISQKCVNGFAMSASIASTYGLNSEFDALVLTLCKFSTLLNVSPELGDITINVAFGQNVKAQLATRTVFSLVQKYGDCMRESWRNIFEVLGQLFKLKLLPKSLIEVDDFCKPNGKFMLVAERVPIQKTDAGLFSSWYLYLSSDNQRQPSHEEQEVIKVSRKCIRECKIDQIINESKFLQFDSLQELLRCLSANLKPPTTHKSLALERYEEDLVVFMLETMVRILIQNRDRLLPIWDNCKDPLYQLLYTDGKDYGYEYLLVRTTIAILKLSAFLMRNEELCPVVLQSLKLILKFKTPSILRLSRQISIGMYELLKTSAQNIHSEADWGIVFAILECVGAGAVQKHYEEERSQGAKSDGAVSSEEDSGLADRGYTSDSEILKSNSMSSTPLVSPLSNENWILVNNETEISPNFIQENCLAYPCKLIEHSPFALVKCWDSLAFIVRNVAHITPYNFEGCVKCIRTFVEASINCGPKSQNRKHSINTELQRKKVMRKENKDRKRPVNNAEEHSSEGEAELESLSDRYPTIAIQLLDLMHTLHTRTAQIFRWWAEEGGAVPQCSALWAQGWCPLLQGIARLATDLRREVRTSAITCLQRALLVHDLQTLSGPEWAGCFKQVLFPLLTCLLNESINDPSLLEESRMRSATIMSKVFLHHLTPLITLPKFSDLWLEILDYLEKFMRVGSDMLYEAMLESLKNMLLVMHSVRIFHNSDGISHAPLWDLTWSKIGSFLPNLKDELFKEEVNVPKPVQVETQPMPQVTFGPIPVGIKTENFVIPVNEVYEIPGPPQQQLGNEVMFSNNQSNGQEAEAVQQGQTFMENYPTYVNQSNVLCNPDPNYNSQMQSAYQQDNLKIESPVKNAIGVQNIPMTVTLGSNQNSPLHSIEPPVPISHLLAGNQYPSLTKVPPPNIVQSFAPVFVQPTNVQSESEIYTDYVNDPYNLTLQNPANGNEQSQMAVPNQSVQDVEGHSKVGVSNIFQSSNYFGNDTVIPPGSEVFFNSP